MKRCVLDTSVGVKWFSQAGEEDLAQALKLRQEFIEGQARLLVPELFFVELANALRYNPHFSVGDVQAALSSVWSMELERVDLSSQALKEVVHVAYQYDVTLYDAIFLALAKAADAELVTADYSLCRKIRGLPYVLPLKNLDQVKDSGRE